MVIRRKIPQGRKTIQQNSSVTSITIIFDQIFWLTANQIQLIKSYNQDGGKRSLSNQLYRYELINHYLIIRTNVL